jgi:hypothetical protein
VGVKDNLKNIQADTLTDIVSVSGSGYNTVTSARTSPVAWASIWPGDTTTGGNPTAFPTATANIATSTAYQNDLHMNLWVWVQDLSNTSSYAKYVYGITMIYTYQVPSNGYMRYYVGTLRTIRSAVPTY